MIKCLFKGGALQSEICTGLGSDRNAWRLLAPLSLGLDLKDKGGHKQRVLDEVAILVARSQTGFIKCSWFQDVDSSLWQLVEANL